MKNVTWWTDFAQIFTDVLENAEPCWYSPKCCQVKTAERQSLAIFFRIIVIFGTVQKYSKREKHIQIYKKKKNNRGQRGRKWKLKNEKEVIMWNKYRTSCGANLPPRPSPTAARGRGRRRHLAAVAGVVPPLPQQSLLQNSTGLAKLANLQNFANF